MLRIPYKELSDKFFSILIQNGVPDHKAKICAETFAANSLDGVYTHGVNRFAKFVAYIRKGVVIPSADAIKVHSSGSLEQWDGNQGIGITNAFQCTERVTELAKVSGLGCVALANTNHWMRAGTYARHLAKSGFASMCWSNTIQNTAAWGAMDPRLGNNPLAIALPFGNDAIVLDIAMSQFSYGALDQYRMKGEKLPVPGGFDADGNLSVDPDAILKSRRTLPIGYWKGSGLSLLLDILAAVLSGGLSVNEISGQKEETRLSQVFIAFNLNSLSNESAIPSLLTRIIDDFHNSIPEDPDRKVRYPGERVLQIREENLMKGIPVLPEVWREILALQA